MIVKLDQMGKIILYGLEASPPVRAVMLTLDALDLNYEFRLVNLLVGEHLTEEYKQKNPQHTVPLLEDDGHYIWESHAIMAYLMTKYAKTDCLYPRDPLLRAKVDQRLHFESGVLFQGCLRSLALPVLFNHLKNPPKKRIPVVARERIDAIYEAYDFLELFLENNKYMCGNELTIADFSIISTVSSFMGIAPIDSIKYPKLKAWMKLMEQLPNYQQNNGIGAAKFINMFANAAILP